MVQVQYNSKLYSCTCTTLYMLCNCFCNFEIIWFCIHSV